jgi:hypothetical protein
MKGASLKYFQTRNLNQDFLENTSGAADFEFLINLIGSKIAKKDTTYRAAVPIEETDRQLYCGFWPWAIRTPVCNHFSKFRYKQSARLSVNSSQASYLVCLL